MNYIDGYVTEVIGQKEWTSPDGREYVLIDVKYDSEGGESETRLMFEKDNVPDISKGYHFLT